MSEPSWQNKLKSALKMDRRSFLTTSVLGSVAIAAGGLTLKPQDAKAFAHEPYSHKKSDVND